MMWSIVGLKRAFMASGFILSMPWEDHFTKSTLQRQERRDKHAIIDPALITSRLVGYCKSTDTMHHEPVFLLCQYSM
jgi:hypothetical protein